MYITISCQTCQYKSFERDGESNETEQAVHFVRITVGDVSIGYGFNLMHFCIPSQIHHAPSIGSFSRLTAMNRQLLRYSCPIVPCFQKRRQPELQFRRNIRHKFRFRKDPAKYNILSLTAKGRACKIQACLQADEWRDLTAAMGVSALPSAV